MGTSRLGMAISEDGIHFKKNPKPILYPDQDSLLKYEWKGGIEDPRIVSTDNGGYILTYTAYDGKTARLCFAFSKDLLHWEKMGPVLKDENIYIHGRSQVPLFPEKSMEICQQQKSMESIGCISEIPIFSWHTQMI